MTGVFDSFKNETFQEALWFGNWVIGLIQLERKREANIPNAKAFSDALRLSSALASKSWAYMMQKANKEFDDGLFA